ncbi:hypothetical protein AB3Y40_06555 [Yoonia sp. R2331]|uniref:hypothetical protein n=1 Tax=Yoonia sp. R2331 TaxID=3237238 RepID=UPI0034E5DC2B
MSDVSIDGRRKLAKTLRRKPSSEATLVFAFGGSVLFVVLFALAPIFVIPVAEATGLSLAAVTVVLSFGTAGLWAAIHGKMLGAKIKAAKAIDTRLRREKSNADSKDTQRKIAEMRSS